MADVPRRVNAAQLAARKIKSSASVRKRLGNHHREVIRNVSQQTDPSATTTSSEATSTASGLFGGAVNAASSFSFSAPGPSVSFEPVKPVDPNRPPDEVLEEELTNALEEESAKEKAMAVEILRCNRLFQSMQNVPIIQEQQDAALAAEVQRRNTPFQMIPMSSTGSKPVSEEEKKAAAAAEVERRNTPFQMVPMSSKPTLEEEKKVAAAAEVARRNTPFQMVPMSSTGSTPISEEEKKAAAAAEVERRNTPFQMIPMSSTGAPSDSSRKNKAADDLAGEADRRKNPFTVKPMLSTSVDPESFNPSGSPFQNLPLSSKDSTNGTSETSSLFKTQQPIQQPISNSNFNVPAMPSTTSLDNHGQAQQMQPANGSNFGLASQSMPEATNTFGQSAATQPANGGIYGSSAPTNSTKKVYTFGQASSHPSSSGASLNPAPPQNPFGETNSSGANFNSPFSNSNHSTAFGQQSAQPSNSDMGFNSMTAPAQPENAFLQPPQPSTQPMFGRSEPQVTSSSNIFAHMQSPAQNTTNFGTFQPPQSSVQPTLMFGQSNPQISSSGNIFSNMQSSTLNTPNLGGVSGFQLPQPSTQPFVQPTLMFGQSHPQTTSSSNIFLNTQSTGLNTANFGGVSGEQQISNSSPYWGHNAEVTTTTSMNISHSEQTTNFTSAVFGNQARGPTTTGLYDTQSQQMEIVDDFGSEQTPSVFGQQERSDVAPNSVFEAAQSASNSLSGQQAVPFSSNLAQNANEQPSSVLTADSSVGTELARNKVINEIPPAPKPVFSILKNPTSVSKSPVIEFGQSLTNNADKPTGHLNANFGHLSKPLNENFSPKGTGTDNIVEDEGRFRGENISSVFDKPGSSMLKDNIFAIANASKASKASNSTNTTSTTPPGKPEKSKVYDPNMGYLSNQSIEEICPPYYNEKQRIQFFMVNRLRSLNKSFLQSCQSLAPAGDYGPSCDHYMKRREEILEMAKASMDKLDQELSGSESISNESKKRTISDETNPEPEEERRKRSKTLQSSHFSKQLPKNSSPLKTQPVINGDQLERNPSLEAAVQNESTTPLKTKPLFMPNGSATPSGSHPSVASFDADSMPSSNSKGKRKAEVQLTPDDESGEEDDGDAPPKKISKLDKSASSSETSNIFRNILDRPGEAPLNARTKYNGSERKILSPRKTSNLTGPPRPNPFANLRPPSESTSPLVSTISTTKSTFSQNSADNPQIKSSNSSDSKPTSVESPADQLPPTASASSVLATKFSSTAKSVNSSVASSPKLGVFETSLFKKKTSPNNLPLKPDSSSAPADNIFSKSVFSTKSSLESSSFNFSAPGATPSNGSSSQTGRTSTNIFGAKTVPGTAGAPSTPSTNNNIKPPIFFTPSTNIFGAKTVPGMAGAPSTPSTSNNIKPPVFGTPSTNIFAAKTAPETVVSGGASSVPPTSNNIKPPVFGMPTNFLAQFGSKSQETLDDIEAKAMEKAKLEELDSDDDEEEWEAKWRENRAAEKKAIEDMGKNKRATFVPGKGFNFIQDANDAKPSSEITGTISKSIPTQQPTVPSTPNTFPSANGSAASSPGATSSTPGSVFDNLPSNKPINFGNNNIFGHLSDADSGEGSGKDNDVNDNNGDNEEDDGVDGKDRFSEPKEELKDKDSNHDLNQDERSEPGSPTTPDSTGRITPLKKSGNLLAPVSGTSTPTSGGSLFDRITKDSNGNPIRQIPTDDKENTEPIGPNAYNGSGTNIFSQLANNTKLQTDNTWKPESPIKFNTSTSQQTISITAPTPTKTSPFVGLFNNTPVSATTSTSPAPSGPFTGLFGHNNTQKPLFPNLSNSSSVGYTFGATSTAASSLLPSVAGSTATSRATSPGVTTDGEAASEAANDPGPENHPQIDLTAGGPGEENENVLFEVRAKALKHITDKDGKEGKWSTKGIGPLRILKHKETGATRVLLRADPSGGVVVNKVVLAQIKYEAAGKTVKIPFAADGNKNLETWVFQVKTPEAAKKLATTLELNKLEVKESPLSPVRKSPSSPIKASD